MALKLVQPDKTAEVSSIVDAFMDLVDDTCSLDSCRDKMGRKTWMITNSESDAQVLIVFDQNNHSLGAQGKHCIVEDEYELANAIEDADRDGFQTIWIHLTFK